MDELTQTTLRLEVALTIKALQAKNQLNIARYRDIIKGVATGQSEAAVGMTLTRMVNNGFIIRPIRGTYRLTPDGLAVLDSWEEDANE